MARNRLSQRVDRAIVAAAERYGIDPQWLRQIARIESGFNPTARRGSYSGLFQLSQAEFERMGGRGEVTNPDANAMAAAALMASNRQAFARRYNTEPTLGDLYMIHQQGWGGYQAHRDNPDAPAWQNMAGTREGRARGPGWAREAVWGNVPRGERGRFANVEGITSRQFLDMWNRRIQPPAPTPDLEGDPEMGTASRRYIPLGPNQIFDPETGERTEMPPAMRSRPEGPPTRTPVEERQEPGFFDRNYPIVHALTGVDRPIGQQLLGSIFGNEGLTSGRTFKGAGSALAGVGRALVESSRRPLPQVLPPMPQLPEQEMQAFLLPERRGRRGIG